MDLLKTRNCEDAKEKKEIKIRLPVSIENRIRIVWMNRKNGKRTESGAAESLGGLDEEENRELRTGRMSVTSLR